METAKLTPHRCPPVDAAACPTHPFAERSSSNSNIISCSGAKLPRPKVLKYLGFVSFRDSGKVSFPRGVSCHSWHGPSISPEALFTKPWASKCPKARVQEPEGWGGASFGMRASVFRTHFLRGPPKKPGPRRGSGGSPASTVTKKKGPVSTAPEQEASRVHPERELQRGAFVTLCKIARSRNSLCFTRPSRGVSLPRPRGHGLSLRIVLKRTLWRHAQHEDFDNYGKDVFGPRGLADNAHGRKQ